MPFEELVALADINPALLIGLLGGALLIIYLATQWFALFRRSLNESRRNELEIARLRKEIELLSSKAEAAPESAWNGCRKFKVTRKVKECDDTFSFYLTPHNNKPLPAFKPGQYLTFEIHLPDLDKPLVRCYSLSDGHLNDEYYRVTIKRALPPHNNPLAKPGIISSYFCDEVAVGDILDVKAPKGRFFLDVDVKRPVVLISGGIGITPMLAMARTLTHINDDRDIYFFFGCRNGEDHMMRSEMLELKETNPNFMLHVCYSRPHPNDKKGVDYEHASRVTIELIKEILPSSNFEYYLCGPGPFMDSLVQGLYDWGVPERDVKFEAFGPATVKKVTTVPFPVSQSSDSEVRFERSDKTLHWDPNMANLLDFAEQNGIKTIEGGCRAGSCGSCLVAIKQGKIEYVMEPGDMPDEGTCLSCICRPAGKLVIDA